MARYDVPYKVQNDGRYTRDRQTMQRTIIKQGYLKKLPNAQRLGSSFKKTERRWFIFGTIGRSDPYLEYYENEESIFGSQPMNIIFLDTCRNITLNQKTSRFCNIFTLTLKDRLLSLVAPTRDAMFEWCRAIEEKLSNLGIMETSHGRNDYIRVQLNFHRNTSHSSDDGADPPSRDYLEVQASGGTFDVVENARAALANGGKKEAFYENLLANRQPGDITEDTYDLSVNGTDGVYMAASPAAAADASDVYLNLLSSTREQSLDRSPSMDSSNADVGATTYSSYKQSVSPSAEQHVYLPLVRASSTSTSASADEQSNLDSVHSPLTEQPLSRKQSGTPSSDQPVYLAILRPSSSTSTSSSSSSSSDDQSNLDSMNSPSIEQPADVLSDHQNAPSVYEPLSALRGIPLYADHRTVSSTEQSTPLRTKQPATPTEPSAVRFDEHAAASSASEQCAMSSASGADCNDLKVYLPSYNEAMSSHRPTDQTQSRYSDMSSIRPPLPHPSVKSFNGYLMPSAERTTHSPVSSSNSFPGRGSDMPPPYNSRRSLQKGANLPLKQIQVQKLMDEMNSPHGVQVIIPKTQCQHSIALVECFNKIWISGWNQRTCPAFQSFLHIGDQLISINGTTATNRKMAKRLLKACAGKTDATLTVKRIPFGQVYAIRKQNNSAVDSLGIGLVNGTAEVGFVDPTGLARQNGLEEKAPAVHGIGGSSSSWWLTEINNQPLDLFIKDDEVNRRLNAIGGHISFVVQPTHLIVEMKKQLKNLSGYKDFLVQ